MAGWFGVTDMRPLKGGKWETVKNPVLGVRFCEMQDGTGYLAVRYAAARYIYGDGVPQHIFEVLKKHRGASIYLRQQVTRKYPCVEVVKYETPEAFQADEGPAKEKLELFAKQRLEAATSHEPVALTLFGEVDHGSRRRKREKRLIGS